MFVFFDNAKLPGNKESKVSKSTFIVAKMSYNEEIK